MTALAAYFLKIRPFINLRNILIVSAIIAVILIALKINSVFNDNAKMKADIAVKNAEIVNLNSSVQYRNDVITEVKKRIEKYETLNKERDIKVTNEKTKSKEYVKSMQSQVEIIKKETPDLLDDYYATQYNSILDCIQDVTEGKDTKC